MRAQPPKSSLSTTARKQQQVEDGRRREKSASIKFLIGLGATPWLVVRKNVPFAATGDHKRCDAATKLVGKHLW